MRSACLGARSARSLITTRPCAVSRKIAFCGSRPAGRLCAEAAVAHTSATSATNKLLMSAPGLPRDGLGELGLEAGRDVRRHEGANIAPHGGDLPDQCGGDRAD